MPMSFATLPLHERQAFFSLLDEYFEARPHLLPNASVASAAAAEDADAYHAEPSSSSSSARPLQAPAPAARKPVESAHSGPRVPSGLSTGKSMGRLDMSSKGAAFGSMIMGQKRPEPPASAGEAIRGGIQSAKARSPPETAPRSLPPPAAAAAVAPDLGQAEVLFDYNGGEAEDLVVKRFEVISLVERVSDDWWKGRSADGRTGIVPSTYVKQL